MRKFIYGVVGMFAGLQAFLNSAVAQSPGSGYGPGMMWGDGGWSMFFFGPFFMIITLVAVVAAIVLMLRWLGAMPASGPMLPQAKTPLDILKERFAKGEIDKTEFEERRRVLGE
jgi:putative membrane protein